MISRVARARSILLVLAITALAFWLRAHVGEAGVSGMIFERHDEAHYRALVVQFLGGDFDVDYFINPTLTMLLVWGLVLLTGVIQVALGNFDSLGDFVFQAALDPYWSTIVGRSLTLTVSVASVVVLYRIGSRLSSPRVGLVAALALAVNRTHVMRSHLFGSECLMVFLLLLFFWAALVYRERPSVRRGALAGLLLGLAAAVKYSSGIHLVTLATASLLAWRAAEGGPKTLLAPRYWVGVPGAAAGFVLGSPFTFVNFQAFLLEFRVQSAFLSEGYSPGDTRAAELGWITYVREFPLGNNGLAFAVLCGLGVIYVFARAIRRRDAAAWMLLAAALPAYMYLGSGIFSRTRFLLVSSPFILLLGAWALDAAVLAVARRLRRRAAERDGDPSWAWAPVLALGVAAMASGAVQTAGSIERLYVEDPRGALMTRMRERLGPARCLDICIRSPRYFAYPRGMSIVRPPDLGPDEKVQYEEVRAKYIWSRPMLNELRDLESFEEVRRRLVEGRETHVIICIHRTRIRGKPTLAEILIDARRSGTVQRLDGEVWSPLMDFFSGLKVVEQAQLHATSMWILELPK